MTATWWNVNYPIRRNIEIDISSSVPIEEGHPIYLDYAPDNLVELNKLREDFEDLEVLFYNSELATPTWTQLGRDVSINPDDNILITFNAVERIETQNSEYYLYMGNYALSGVVARPAYESALYVIVATPDNNQGLMFSRPTEDWDNGVSDMVNARATLAFAGINMRMTVEKGPNRGILEVRLDTNTPIYIDTYSATVSESIVYELSNLDPGRHYIRMRVTGNKAPSSIGHSIKLISMSYSRYVSGTDLGEEFYSLTGPVTAIVGP